MLLAVLDCASSYMFRAPLILRIIAFVCRQDGVGSTTQSPLHQLAVLRHHIEGIVQERIRDIASLFAVLQSIHADQGQTENVDNRTMLFQSSQIVSRLRSPRLSAPQTLQRFLLSRLPKPPRPLPRLPEMSNAFFPLLSSPSSASAAALSCRIRSASRAASSASGESGMVSRLEILGLRERAEVGVDETLEDVK